MSLLDRLSWITAPWEFAARFSDMQRDITRLQWRTDLLEESLMARVDELRERLAAATDELARDLDDLRGRLAAQDEALAAELEPMVARLEAMGRDPQNPVPDAPEGEAPAGGDAGTGTDAPAGPAAGDGTDVVNPTPDAADNPNA